MQNNYKKQINNDVAKALLISKGIINEQEKEKPIMTDSDFKISVIKEINNFQEKVTASLHNVETIFQAYEAKLKNIEDGVAEKIKNISDILDEDNGKIKLLNEQMIVVFKDIKNLKIGDTN